MEKKRKIVLVDSNNIAYRAFYALPQTIVTSTGTMTNAVLGFTSMILKLLEDQKPDIIICAFDSKGPTFRHELFEEYKATRKKMPDELIGQMPLIKEVLESLNISTLAFEGFEADDIIATLTDNLSGYTEEIIIVSSDKDILQLVSDNVKVMAIKKGITDTTLYDEEQVIEKFGVKPDKIKELLALMGDSSDNIPGISGIGPKTALELIRQFGTIDAIYENTGDVKNEKLKKLLIENEGNAKKSRTLIELNSKLQIDIQAILEKSSEGFDPVKAESVFSLLEFNTLKKRLKAAFQSSNIIQAEVLSTSQLSTSKNKNDFDSAAKYKAAIFQKKLNKGLTDSAVFLKDKKLYAALSKTGFLLLMDSLNNFYIFDRQTFSDSKEAGKLAILLENSEIVKSGFDFKQIYKFLKKYGIDIQGKIIDYKILYLLLNPDKSDISLEELFLEMLDIDIASRDSKSPGFETAEIENQASKQINNQTKNDDLIGRRVDPANDHISSQEEGQIEGHIEGHIEDRINGKTNCPDYSGNPEHVNSTLKDNSQMAFSFEDEGSITATQKSGSPNINYSDDFESPEKLEKDNIITMLIEALMRHPQLEEILSKKITKEELDRLYDTIEGPLVKVLADMEFKGVNIDRQYLGQLIKEYSLDIDGLTKDIYGMCGTEFNINSTQQLAEILYKRLNLTSTKKTKTGFSTNASSLFAIYDSHPVIGRILDYREKVKLKNTYIDVLPNLVDPADGRVHATYNQLGTTTGRISSNNPNLQNIPVRTELGKQIRKAFIPGKGYDLLISADYSQIELRILAHLSQDEDLISAFNSGQDIHTRTASEIFQVNYEDVDDNLRRKAKAINFGIIYGMTEFGLKSRLSISEEEAREYIRLYFARYPKVKRYINFLIETAYRTGTATTMFGRKRYIKELASTNANLRSLGERLAVNTPIQGSAADIMKLATVVLFSDICRKKLDCNIILHVHDEIVLEFRKNDTDVVKNLVITSMENCVKLVTRLKVDVKIAENWYI
jgi:DNA polymerase I - 3''-5'' exonuclease and polymerase domains